MTTARPSARVDWSLFRVRWILWLLIFPIAWIDTGSLQLTPQLWAWLLSVAIINLTIGLALRFTARLDSYLPVLTLALDTILFGILPYLIDPSVNLLAFFAIFPALVGAIRFGPELGLGIAALLSISVGVRALVRTGNAGERDIFTTGLPIATLLAATLLIGYLTRHEKDAAVREAAMELDKLRDAMAGAKLLYQTTDALTLTTSYRPVLESMLDAGVSGLPVARRADGTPVGIALLFDDQDPERRLCVVAARGLDRNDLKQRIQGKAGIVGETLQTGSAVVFDNVSRDPELAVFGTVERCSSGVCYPLQAGLEQYGVVLFATPAPRRPSQEHLDLMRAFTSEAGIAFQNARLYQNSRAEQDRIIQSEHEMRQKLARDLHDGPTQRIAGLVMQLDYISRLLDKDPEEAKRELEKARAMAQQTVKEIRTALFALRPLALETKGLSAALEQYCERLRETENVAIRVEPGDFGIDFDRNIAATVFAIIEEAVSNARKHAARAPIFVTAERKNDSLVARVQDQGPGFNLGQIERSYEERSSLGLQNMRDRAKLINADLRIVSAPGQGTRVTLIVPLPPSTLIEPRK